MKLGGRFKKVDCSGRVQRRVEVMYELRVRVMSGQLTIEPVEISHGLCRLVN